MMLRFRASVDGVQVARRGLSRFGEGIRDLRPWFDEEEREFYSRTRQWFRTEGDGRWAANSPVYLERKRAAGYSDKRILQLDGTLLRSLTRPGSRGSFLRVSRLGFEIGTTLVHGIVHHRGSDARMWVPAPFFLWINGVPKREIIVVDEKTIRESTRRLQRYLVTLWRGSSLFDVAQARR